MLFRSQASLKQKQKTQIWIENKDYLKDFFDLYKN